jgi:PAS domain S-box-containing protein
MWDWDIPTGTVYYGKRWAEILGYSPDEIEPGMAFWERLVHPDDKAHVTEILRKHLKGTVPLFECEYRMRNRFDQWKWILAKGRVTGRGPDGRALRVTGTYMDITQRKEAELALRLFRQIIEHTNEAVAISDRMGRLVYVNPAYEALFGRPFHESVSLEQFESFVPESVEILMGEVLPRLHLGESWEGELDAIDALGRRFTLWKRADAICDDEGNLMYAFGIMHDATEQKEAEARRLDMERRLLMSQKHESLGAMASAVAHHFNNLLMGVLGNLELLQDDLSLDDRSLGILAQAQRAARRATELSRVMMTCMGQGIGMRAMRDLSRLVAGILPGIQDSLPVQVSWETMLTQGLPKILVDADALREVVLNLAGNALESLGETGGRVVVRTGAAACDEVCLARTVGGEALAPGDYVYVEVCDNGCGMDADVVARMFDPFFSTKFTGRGLGLASVLGIVRAHQGAISVDSRPGAGTTVRVLLPAAGRPE